MNQPTRFRFQRYWTFAAWATVLALLLSFMVLLWGLPVETSDFYDFYLATETMLAGQDPYGPQENGLQGFFNPLWATFPFIPLMVFGPSGAFWAWQFLLLLLLAGSAFPLFRLYGARLTPDLLLLLGWLFLIPWFVGQNAPLVAAGAFLAIWAGERGRWGLAGALAPLMAVKPHTIPLLPLLLLARGRRAVLTAGLGSGLATGVLAMLLIPTWPVAWLTSSWSESQTGGGEEWPASGMLNALEYLGLPLWIYPLTVVGVLLLLWWRRQDPWRVQAALALALGLVLAPYVRAGDFTLLLPALLLLPPFWYRIVGFSALAIFLIGVPVPLFWLIPALFSGALLLFVMVAPDGQPGQGVLAAGGKDSQASKKPS